MAKWTEEQRRKFKETWAAKKRPASPAATAPQKVKAKQLHKITIRGDAETLIKILIAAPENVEVHFEN